MVTPLRFAEFINTTKRAGGLKLLSLLLLNLLLSTVVFAQTPKYEVPPGNPLPNQNNLPFGEKRFPLSNQDPYERSAAIYLGSEFLASGTTGGNIETIGYYVEAVDNPQPVYVRIYLKQTSASTLTSDDYAAERAGALQVFEGTVSVTQTGWIDITLNQNLPYNYIPSATNNLEVLVETECGPIGNCTIFGTSTQGSEPFGTNKTFRLSQTVDPNTQALVTRFETWNDLTPPENNPNYNGAVHTNRPNARFGIAPTAVACNAPSVASTPTTATTATVNITGGSAGTYELTFSPAPAGSTPQPVTTSGSAFNISGLNPGTTYSYSIRTNCGSGNFSAPVNGTFTTSCPSPVVSSVTAGPESLTFTYTASPGTSTITLTSTSAQTVVTTLGPSPATITGLAPNTVYNYSIVTDCGDADSQPATGTAPATQAVTVVCNAPAVSGTPTTTATTATVNITGGSTGTYELTFSPAPSGSTPQPVTTTGSTFNISGLSPGTTYSYSIRTNCGNGNFSTPVTGSFTTTCPSPVVNNVTAGPESLTFTYTASPGTSTITLTSTSAQTVVTTLGPSPATISGLAPNTVYNYSIVTDCGDADSQPATGIAPATQAVTVVCNAPAVTSSSATATTATVNITGGSAGTYELTFSPVPAGSTPQPVTTSGSAFNISGLNPGTTYSYSIRTNCGSGNFSAPVTGSFTTSCPSPVVSSVTAGPESLTFTYTASPGTSTITLTSTSAATVVTTLGPSPATITGLAPNTVYNYSIVTDCGDADSPATTGTAPATQAVTVVCNAPAVSGTPTTTATTATVNITGGSTGTYELTFSPAPSGSTPQPVTTTGSTFNISGLTPGTTYSYSIRTNCGNGNFSAPVTGNFTTTCPAVSGVTVAAINSTDVQVSYTPSPSNGTSTITFTNGGVNRQETLTGTSPLTFTGFTPGATYTYSIVTNCTANTSTPITGSVVMPGQQVTCTAPTVQSVVSNSPNSVDVTYTPSSGAGSYQITLTSNTAPTVSQTLGASPANVPNLQANTLYNFSIVKDCGGGDLSSAITGSVQTQQAAVSCNPVTVNSVVSNSPNSIIIDYTAPSAGTHTITLTSNTAPTVVTTLDPSPAMVSGLQANTAYTYSIVTSCTAGGTSAPATGSAQTQAQTTVCVTGTWLGTTSSDWHTAANWCNGQIPAGTTNVLIPVSTTATPVPNYPVITADAFANNLIIEAGATLTFAPPAPANPNDVPALLTINGSFLNAGTFTDNGNGSVTFINSPLPQSLGKPGQTLTFLDLTTGVGGIVQNGPIHVRRVLTLNGNFNNLANHELKLLADNIIQSMVVNNGSAVVQGQATMEKYINPGTNQSFGYRHLTSPVTGATLQQLNDDTPLVVNPAYNTNPTPGTTVPFPTIYRYNESRLDLPIFTAPNFDSGWESPNDLNEVMQPAVGYTVNMLPVEVDFTGTLNNGSYTRTLTRGNQPRSGYNFLGNPYPAPLDWDLVTLPAGAVDRAAYVVRTTGQYTGTYVAYVNGIPDGGNLIAAMQGFFVRATVPSTSITFENNDRVTTYQNPALYKKAETRPLLALALRDAAGIEDKTYVYFENGATANFDGYYDAFKLPSTGPVPSLFTRAGNDQLAINGLPLSNATTIVPLGGKVPQAGTWTISADQMLNFLPGQIIYLEDIATNTLHNLSQQNSYTFSTAQTDLSGRFFLRFGPATVSGMTPAELAVKVQVYPNPNNGAFTISMPALNTPVVEATLYNAVGQRVWQQELPTNGTYLKETITLRNLVPGVYSLRLETAAGPVQRKIIIE